jgi:hypothetical protein
VSPASRAARSSARPAIPGWPAAAGHARAASYAFDDLVHSERHSLHARQPAGGLLPPECHAAVAAINKPVRSVDRFAPGSPLFRFGTGVFDGAPRRGGTRIDSTVPDCEVTYSASLRQVVRDLMLVKIPKQVTVHVNPWDRRRPGSHQPHLCHRGAGVGGARFEEAQWNQEKREPKFSC